MSGGVVVDTSVIVALVEGEPEAEQLERALDKATQKAMGAPSVLEAMMVLSRLRGADSGNVVMATLAAFDIEVIAFEPRMVTVAFNAFLQFGKGRHQAALNFGDCLAYALAKERGDALLFKGKDFLATDAIGAKW